MGSWFVCWLGVSDNRWGEENSHDAGWGAVKAATPCTMDTCPFQRLMVIFFVFIQSIGVRYSERTSPHTPFDLPSLSRCLRVPQDQTKCWL